MADSDQSLAAQQQQMCIAPPPASSSSNDGNATPAAPGPAAGDAANAVLRSIDLGTISAGATMKVGASANVSSNSVDGEQAQQAYDLAHDTKGNYDMVHDAMKVEESASPMLNAASKGAGGIFSMYDMVNGANAIAEHKSIESTAGGVTDLVSGGAGTAGLVSTVTEAAGFGATAFGGAAAEFAAAANPVGLVATAGAFGMKTAQRGDEMTKELGWYGQRQGSVGPDGKPINYSASDWAAQQAVERENVTYDENGKRHQSYDPTFGGAVDAALTSMSQAPAVIAAGLYGMGKDLVGGIGHLFGAKTDAEKAQEQAVANADAKRAHDERVDDYRNASPEQRAMLEQIDATVNSVTGKSGPSLQDDMRTQDAQVGSSLLTSGAQTMASAMQLPEGPGRDALLEVARGQQQAGLARMNPAAAAAPADGAAAAPADGAAAAPADASAAAPADASQASSPQYSPAPAPAAEVCSSAQPDESQQ